MSDTRKEYTVLIGGVPHTLLLDEEAAARYGENAKLGKPAANKQASAPKNKGA